MSLQLLVWHALRLTRSARSRSDQSRPLLEFRSPRWLGEVIESFRAHQGVVQLEDEASGHAWHASSSWALAKNSASLVDVRAQVTAGTEVARPRVAVVRSRSIPPPGRILLSIAPLLCTPRRSDGGGGACSSPSEAASIRAAIKRTSGENSVLEAELANYTGNGTALLHKHGPQPAGSGAGTCQQRGVPWTPYVRVRFNIFYRALVPPPAALLPFRECAVCICPERL